MTLDQTPDVQNDDREGWLTPAMLAVMCATAGILVVFNAHLAVRPPLVLGAMIAGPGWAVCGFMRVRDRRLVWAVAVSVGLALNVLLSLVMIATHTWHPVSASVLLLFGSAAVLASRSVTAARGALGLGAP